MTHTDLCQVVLHITLVLFVDTWGMLCRGSGYITHTHVQRFWSFMLGSPSIMNYVYNNQIDALLILSL
jgi:hypothetical protein